MEDMTQLETSILSERLHTESIKEEASNEQPIETEADQKTGRFLTFIKADI